jgi:uncharacterized protein YdaU (DUF1376 family)
MPKYYQPFFWGDYLKDTGTLSLLEHGAYLRLIGEYWNTGKPIPADANRIRRACQAHSEEEFKAIDYVLERYFKRTDTVWVHSKIERDLAAQEEYQKKKSEAGKTAANARWEQERAMRDACEPQCDGNATHSTPLQTHSISIKTPREGGSLREFEKGNGGFDILHLLSEEGLEGARRAAPGWDIYHLAGIYNKGLGIRGERPKKPDAAFAGWCRKYTSEKPPL